MSDCIFCKIVAGEVPTKLEYEDDDLVVFNDIRPSAPVHVLIVPKKHVFNLLEATETDSSLIGKLQLTAGLMAQKLGIAKAYKVIVNGGSLQEVPHLHYHLVGGWRHPEEGGEN